MGSPSSPRRERIVARAACSSCRCASSRLAERSSRSRADWAPREDAKAGVHEHRGVSGRRQRKPAEWRRSQTRDAVKVRALAAVPGDSGAGLRALAQGQRVSLGSERSSAAGVCMVVFRTLASIEADWINPWMDYLVRLDKEAQGMFANGVRAPKYAKQSLVMTNKKFTDWAVQNNYMFASDKK